MTIIETLIKNNLPLDLKSREEIDVGCEPVTNFEELHKFKNLKSFLVYNTQFNNISDLSGCDLIWLDISCTAVKNLRGMTEFRSLRSLDIRGNKLDDDSSLMEIYHLKNLERLNIDWKYFYMLMPGLGLMPSLKTVNGYKFSELRKKIHIVKCIKRLQASVQEKPLLNLNH